MKQISEVKSLPPMPTTTAHAARLHLYQPTRRPSPLRGEIIDTPWGRIKMWGRLGQQHADVLESICFCREGKATLEDGRIKLLVDPARVRRRSDQVSGSTFAAILTELQQAVIEIKEPQKLACSGHLIDHIDKAIRADGTPITRHNPLTGERREMWRVELGKALCTLVREDFWVGYDPAPLSRLTHGISQALARIALTHKDQPRGGWKIDTLIQSVSGGEGQNSVYIRHRRREIRQDAAALATVGIKVEGDRVFRCD